MEQSKILHHLGMELLGWAICSAGAFACFLLQYIGSVSFSAAEGTGMVMRVNPVWYGLGAVLCVACFIIVWRLILRRTLLDILKLERVWLIVWILLGLKSLAAQFVLFWFGEILLFGLMGAEHPVWTTGFIIAYVFFVPIFILADAIRQIRKQE